jgi:hypothetical protein
MGYLRFRRSLRLLPGVRVNLSKSGVSTSIGRRGLWFTVGPLGTRETVGIPGTGISYTEQQSNRATHAGEGPQAPPGIGGLTVGRALLWVVILGIALLVFALAFRA